MWCVAVRGIRMTLGPCWNVNMYGLEWGFACCLLHGYPPLPLSLVLKQYTPCTHHRRLTAHDQQSSRPSWQVHNSPHGPASSVDSSDLIHHQAVTPKHSHGFMLHHPHWTEPHLLASTEQPYPASQQVNTSLAGGTPWPAAW
jgi:hypothetical protein